MRRSSAVVTAVVGAAALAGAWRTGSAAAPGRLSGVRVITPAPSPPAASPHPGTRGSATPAPAARRTIDGALVATPYGDVQVAAVVRSGHLLDVRALHLTDSSGTSRQISAVAAPVLRREALRAGSARIDTVSGATFTSEGYRTSLQAALDAAAR